MPDKCSVQAASVAFFHSATFQNFARVASVPATTLASPCLTPDNFCHHWIWLVWAVCAESSDSQYRQKRPSPTGLLEKNLPCSLRSRGFFFGKVLSAIPAQSGEVA